MWGHIRALKFQSLSDMAHEPCESECNIHIPQLFYCSKSFNFQIILFLEIMIHYDVFGPKTLIGSENGL